MNFTGNPMAVQLYTLRTDAEKDFPGVLRQVAKVGYGAVEFAGLHNNTPEQIAAVLKETGLKPCGSHVSYDDLAFNFDKTTHIWLDIIGCEYLVVPSGPRDFGPNGQAWKVFVEKMHTLTTKCREKKIKLCYHNHNFEFEPSVDGKTAFDVMFFGPDAATAPLSEMDLYWVAKGGHDPVKELGRLKGRVPMVHVKDMAATPDKIYTEVGAGILPWKKIFDAAHNAGVKWLIVEQDHPTGPAIDSIKTSLENLKKLGLA